MKRVVFFLMTIIMTGSIFAQEQIQIAQYISNEERSNLKTEQMCESLTHTSTLDDDWIEIGEITLERRKGYMSGQMYCISYEDGLGDLPFKKIKAVLYVKEFNSGKLIYRIAYQGTYYTVQSDGKVCMNVTHNGQQYKNVILYCTLPY